MRTIWKFPLKDGGTFQMPRGARVLSVGTQGDEIMLWALVDTEAVLEERIFFVAGTGYNMRRDGVYIGTVQTDGGRFVWHVFEVVSYA